MVRREIESKYIDYARLRNDCATPASLAIKYGELVNIFEARYQNE